MTHHKGHVITIAFLAMVSASAYAQQQHTDSQHADQKTSSGSQLLQRAPQVQISRTPISNRPSLPPSIFRSPNTPRYSTPSSSGNDWLQRRQSYQPPQRSNPLRPSQPSQPTWHSPVVDRTRQGDLLQHRDPIMTPPSNPVIG